MKTYEQQCEDFALHSSPAQEHWEHEANAAFDDHHERWAAEAADMQMEGFYNECEAIENADMTEEEKTTAMDDAAKRYGVMKQHPIDMDAAPISDVEIKAEKHPTPWG